MVFFQTVTGSLTNLHAYAGFLLHNTLRQTLKYVLKFYLLLLCIGLVGVIIGSVFVSNTLKRIYPNDLVFSYTNGELQIKGASLPFHLSIPYMQAPIVLESKVVTITTTDLQHISYTELLPNPTTVEITKSTVAQYAMPILIIAGITMVIMLWIAILFSRTLSLVSYTALLYFFMKFFGKRVPYMFFLQLGLFVLVAAESVSLASILLYRNTIVPVFDLAFLGIFLLVLFTNRKPHQA